VQTFVKAVQNYVLLRNDYLKIAPERYLEFCRKSCHHKNFR